MRQRKVIRTTLGELIVAITDEVAPIIRNPSAMHILVSFVLTDLLPTIRCVFTSGHDKNSSHFAEELTQREMK